MTLEAFPYKPQSHKSPGELRRSPELSLTRNAGNVDGKALCHEGCSAALRRLTVANSCQEHEIVLLCRVIIVHLLKYSRGWISSSANKTRLDRWRKKSNRIAKLAQFAHQPLDGKKGITGISSCSSFPLTYCSTWQDSQQLSVCCLMSLAWLNDINDRPSQSRIVRNKMSSWLLQRSTTMKNMPSHERSIQQCVLIWVLHMTTSDMKIWLCRYVSVMNKTKCRIMSEPSTGYPWAVQKDNEKH